MDEWKDSIADWQRTLGDWQARFDAEYAARARARAGWFKQLTQGEREEIADQARRAAGEDVAVQSFATLQKLCDAYLAEVLPAQRAKVRAWMGADPNTSQAAWDFAHHALELTRGADAATHYRRGLAALSILDLRRDYNAVLALLARYWIVGREQGLDPRAHFEAAAKLSNPGMGGGGACFAQVLRGFEASSYFRASVKPHLGRASA